jgi:diguanylate cyclase (GGDEF)-like protein/PAS domain S-box-containing protein
MTAHLISSVTLFLSISLLYGFIVHYFYKSKLTQQVLAGLLFGGICVVGMMFPIELNHGVIIDPRSVVLSIAGLFGGPIGAAIATIIGGGYRLFIGGSNSAVYVGISIVIVSSSLGLAYRYGIQKGWAKLNAPQLLLFSLFVQLTLILIAIPLPSTVFDKIMSTVALPRFLIFTFASLSLGLLLKLIGDSLTAIHVSQATKSQLSDHLQNTPLAAISWDRDFHVTQWNKAAERIFGYTAAEAMGRHPADFILESSSRIEMDQVHNALLENTGGSRSSNDNITKYGKTINCEWYNTTLLDDVGKIIGVASLCEDVTDRRQAEVMIWEQANFDTLTGLANRQMASDRLEQEIKKADRSKKNIALMFFDLDGFKDVNDTLGHDVGDNLLVQVAKRLRSHIRDIDTIARFGGDEFVIIMGGLDSADPVDQIANELVKKIVEPFTLGGATAFISTSVGITIYPQDASNSIEMFRNADQAMYASKNNGGNRFQYFTPSMQQQASSRMSLISDLRTAIKDNQFQLHYQPIVNLINGDIHKAEALIRWQHPERGLVDPFEFIPIAEETKLIVSIGDWVFRESCRQSSIWRASFNSNFQININTSPVQYKDKSFSANDWLEHLRMINLSGEGIVVEITEGTLIESGTDIDQALFAFRDANIQVALDDFGTGYSSLSLLKKLDIDYLKIDKSFVDNLAPGSSDMALCKAIIVMAHALELKVVAEGIETEEQRALLLAAGCDYGQGYLFSKPLPASEFENLLKSRKN